MPLAIATTLTTSPLRAARAIALTAVIVCSAIVASSAAAEVAVSLHDGRRFVAAVDERTDDAKLWLRFGDGPTTIRRAFDWSAIRSATEGRAAADNARLRELGRQARANMPAVDAPAVTRVEREAGFLRTWRLPHPSSSASPFTGTIRALDASGYLANWDADVEADGVLLTFAALDEFGAPALVEGTLEAELIAERLPPYSRGNAFPVLARWQRAVTSAELKVEGGLHRVRLEFQAQHPDYQLYLPRYALLHVRFSVPGQGTFDASQDGLSLRGFTPVRDRLESASGTRLFPTEQTGRGHRESSMSQP